MMLRCMRSRRRSRKRYSRRRSSLTPSSVLIVKGSGAAAPSTSTSVTSISISPVGQVRVHVVGATCGDLAVDPDDGLLGELRQGFVAGRAGAGDELHETVVVAQIDEEDAAQVSTIVQPAAQPDVGADVRGAELAAGVGPVPMHRRSSSLRGWGGFSLPRLPPAPPRLHCHSYFKIIQRGQDHPPTAALGGVGRAHLHKVGQCAPRKSWPRRRPACGAGTTEPVRSRSTRRRPGCSSCPAEAGVFREAAVRARFHPVDWNEIYGVVNLALAEGTLAEARLRIVDGGGRVLRTVRSRSKPLPVASAGSESYVLVGTLQEVAEPQPGTTGAHTPITGDWRRSREAFLLDAGRALAEARSTAEVLRVAASLSMPGFSPDGLAVFGVAGERLTIIGHHGHNKGDEDPFNDMPLETDYPAAEVVRTGRAIYLPIARGVPPPLPGHLAAGQPLRAPLLGLPAADRVGPHDGCLDGGVPAPGVVLAGRAFGADDGGPDARPGPGTGRGGRDRAGAVAGAPAVDDADPGPRDPRHDGRRPVRADRWRAPGGRRLVRHDPAPQRPYRPRHRRRPGP